MIARVICFVALGMLFGGPAAGAHGEKNLKNGRVVHTTRYERPFLHTSDPSILFRMSDPKLFAKDSELTDLALLVPEAWAKQHPIVLRVHDPAEKDPMQYVVRSELHNYGKAELDRKAAYNEFSFTMRRDYLGSSVILLNDAKGLVIVHLHKIIGEQD